MKKQMKTGGTDKRMPPKNKGSKMPVSKGAADKRGMKGC